MNHIKAVAIGLSFWITGVNANTNEDLSLLIKEIQYIERIAIEMKARNSDENQRVRFSYDKLALRLEQVRYGIESHIELIQSAPRWDRLGVDSKAQGE